MRGRLNLFQASMRRWRELHPYCASHVIAVDAQFDERRLRATIGGVLVDCGLTGLAVDAASGRYAYEGGEASVDLAVIAAGDEDAFDVAARQIEAAINVPFPAGGRYDPFRFFAIHDGERFLVGVTYDHFIAGGDSIAVLVTDIADRYVSESMPLPRLERYPPGYARLFARQLPAFVSGLASLPALLAGWRRAIRPHLADPADGTNGFVHFRIDAERAARLKRRARDWAITTNDLLLALLYRAALPIAAQRRHTGRRTDIALASIVNVRADFQPPATEVFGQFLSSFRVVHALDRDAPLEAIARAIGAQTSRAKRNKLYLVTLVAMSAAALLWRLANVQRRQRLYVKYHPVFAGLTPLNVNALRRRSGPRDTDYLRAASTGPMAPMVAAVTTSGSNILVGITYRRTALSRSDIDGVVQALLQGMETLQ